MGLKNKIEKTIDNIDEINATVILKNPINRSVIEAKNNFFFNKNKINKG